MSSSITKHIQVEFFTCLQFKYQWLTMSSSIIKHFKLSFSHAFNFEYFFTRRMNHHKYREIFLIFSTSFKFTIQTNFDQANKNPITTIWKNAWPFLETRPDQAKWRASSNFNMNQPVQPKMTRKKFKFDWSGYLLFVFPTTNQRKLLIKENGLGRKTSLAQNFPFCHHLLDMSQIGKAILKSK